MKVLKFIALLLGMYLLGNYVPYGHLVNMGIMGYALWNLV